MGYNSFEFAGEVCSSLLQDLNDQAMGTAALNIWTDCTAALTKVWQTGPSYMSTSGKMATVLGYSKDPTDFNNWITDNLTDANQFSSKDITDLLKALSNNWDTSSGSASSTMMSEIQQFGNLVSATQQIQTSTGDTETKSQASFLQQMTSAGQTKADMGNSAVGILSSIASMLMQSFL
jgi:hypothetical protein